MPKLKTHKGASKRFKKTGTGKIKRNHAFARHILTSKSRARKRRLGQRCHDGRHQHQGNRPHVALLDKTRAGIRPASPFVLFRLHVPDGRKTRR